MVRDKGEGWATRPGLAHTRCFKTCMACDRLPFLGSVKAVRALLAGVEDDFELTHSKKKGRNFIAAWKGVY
jgi:hypothetical protein